MSNLFASFLKDHGVQHQLSIPYNPQQNGMAERLNQTIVESVWCMLHHAWTNACQDQAEAVNTTTKEKPPQGIGQQDTRENMEQKKTNNEAPQSFWVLSVCAQTK